MLISVDQWVLVSAVLVVLLQANEARKIRSQFLLAASLVSPVVIAYVANNFIVHFSIIQLHQIIADFGPLIGVVILLEVLVITKGYVERPLPTASFIAALIYLQMYFYQTGWLSWNFEYMALVYGSFTMALMWSVKCAFDVFTPLPIIIAAFQFLLVGLVFAKLPGISTQIVPVNWQEILTSALLLGGMLVAGFFLGVFKQKLEKNRIT